MQAFDLFVDGEFCAEAARHGYVFRGHLSSIDDVATHFGLRALGKKWIRLSMEEAALALEHVLALQLAHGSERFPRDRAKKIAEIFVHSFPSDAEFASNCRWFEKPKYDSVARVSIPPQFESATDATFDGGIVVLSDRLCGVLWLEDED